MKDLVIKDFKKTNLLVLNGSFDLTSLQQDLLNIVFASFADIQIGKNVALTLKCSDIRSRLHWDDSFHNDYIKKQFDLIRDKSVEISYFDANRNKIKDTFFYFYRVKHNTKNGLITLYFDYDWYSLMAYGLQHYYTLYNFETILSVKGKYAKRLYEMFTALLKREGMPYVNFRISPYLLRYKLKYAYKYPSDVLRKIIMPAIKEIESKTNYHVFVKFDKDTNLYCFSIGDGVQVHNDTEWERVQRVLSYKWFV